MSAQEVIFESALLSFMLGGVQLALFLDYLTSLEDTIISSQFHNALDLYHEFTEGLASLS